MANPFAVIPFPGQNLSPLNPKIARLPSGAALYFPPGNYLARVGGQSVIQWKDSYSGLWRNIDAGPNNNPVWVPSDGTNYRALNMSGTIQGANVTTPGTAYTQAGTTLTFAAPVSGGVTATATPIIGGSMSLSVSSTGGSGGTGYTDPIILIPAPQILGGTPGLCIPASATAAVSAGVLGAITMDFAGAGYTSLPGTGTITVTPANYQANPSFYDNNTNIVIIDPAGTGAVIIPTATNGTSTSGGVTGVVINNNGTLYDGTHIPAVTITCAGSSGTAAATALPWLALTGVTVAGTNTGYTASVSGITSLSSAAANPIVKISGEPILIRPGRFIADQTAGALGTPVIEDAGGGFQTVPLAKQIGNATADGSVNATFTAVVGGVNNTLIYWEF